MQEFDIELSKEFIASNYDGGLFSLLEGMTWQLGDFKKEFIYNKLALWPQKMRDEVYSLIGFDKFNPKPVNEFKVPDFENVNGKPFKHICEDSKFKHYCQLASKVPKLRKLLKVMKYGGSSTGTFDASDINLDFMLFSKNSKGSSKRLATVPVCWFGNASGLFLNSPDLTYDQAYAYTGSNKTFIDLEISSTLNVSIGFGFTFYLYCFCIEFLISISLN